MNNFAKRSTVFSVENGSSPGTSHGPRPKSMAVVDNGWESQGTNLVHAAYAYLSSGDNQLSFHEGDTIAISGKSTASKAVDAFFFFFIKYQLCFVMNVREMSFA